MPEDDLSFAPTPERLSDIGRAILAGDPAAAVDGLRKATEVPLNDFFQNGLVVIGVIYAIAALLKQVRPVAQPFADALAERIGEPHDEATETVARSQKP